MSVVADIHSEDLIKKIEVGNHEHFFTETNLFVKRLKREKGLK